MKLLPLITEANAISEELNKYIHFEVVIVPSVAVDQESNVNSRSVNQQKY